MRKHPLVSGLFVGVLGSGLLAQASLADDCFKSNDQDAIHGTVNSVQPVIQAVADKEKDQEPVKFVIPDEVRKLVAQCKKERGSAGKGATGRHAAVQLSRKIKSCEDATAALKKIRADFWAKRHAQDPTASGDGQAGSSSQETADGADRGAAPGEGGFDGFDENAPGMHVDLIPSVEFTRPYKGQPGEKKGMTFFNAWYETADPKTEQRHVYFWHEGEYDGLFKPTLDEKDPPDHGKIVAGTIQDTVFHAWGLKVKDPETKELGYDEDIGRSYRFVGRCRYVSDYGRGMQHTVNCYAGGQGMALEKELGKGFTIGSEGRLSLPGLGYYKLPRIDSSGPAVVVGGLTINGHASKSFDHEKYELEGELEYNNEAAYLLKNKAFLTEQEFSALLSFSMPHGTTIYYEASHKPALSGMPAGATDPETVQRIGFGVQPGTFVDAAKGAKRLLKKITGRGTASEQ